MADPLDRYRFVCRGCHARYTHRGECEICGSEIVVEAEWPRSDERSMVAPEPRPHIGTALLAMVCAPASVALAWGQTTLWGVVPCALVTVALVVAPVTRWTKSDEEIEGFARAAPFDGHALQEGAAREMAAVTSSRRPIGCVGLFVGVVLPLILIRPE